MTAPLESLQSPDRILLGACAAVWLGALGAGVAAAVALVDLGRGHVVQGPDSADTPWLLYTIIGISVVVIVAAVPLLLRARAQADTRQPANGPLRASQQPLPPRRTLEAEQSAPVVVSGYGGDDSSATAKVEQLWLRYTLAVTCAMGVATAAIGVATYLMATDRDIAAWCLYGFAGVVTAGMVALPVVALRQLDALTA